MLQVNLNSASRTQGGNSFDDSTLPLIDRNQKTGRAPLAPGPVAGHLVIPQPGRVPFLLLTPGSLGTHPRPLVRALSCFSGLEMMLGVFV